MANVLAAIARYLYLLFRMNGYNGDTLGINNLIYCLAPNEFKKSLLGIHKAQEGNA